MCAQVAAGTQRIAVPVRVFRPPEEFIPAWLGLSQLPPTKIPTCRYQFVSGSNSPNRDISSSCFETVTLPCIDRRVIRREAIKSVLWRRPDLQVSQEQSHSPWLLLSVPLWQPRGRNRVCLRPSRHRESQWAEILSSKANPVRAYYCCSTTSCFSIMNK